MPTGVYKRKPFSEEHRRNLSLAGTGKTITEERRKHLSEAHKGVRGPYNLSDAQRKRKSDLKKGKNNPNWKDGSSHEPYSIDWTETLRRSIRERDHYICQLCSKYGNTVHHKDYNKKNCDPTNLITLCQKCNLKVNHNRSYWTKYFYEL